MNFKEWLKVNEINFGLGRSGGGPYRDRRNSPYADMDTDRTPNYISQGASATVQGLGNIMMNRLYPKGNQPSFGANFPSLMQAVEDSMESQVTRQGIVMTGRLQLTPPNEAKKDDYLAVQRHTVNLIKSGLTQQVMKGEYSSRINTMNPEILDVWVEQNNIVFAKIRFRWLDDYETNNFWSK